MKGTSIFSWVRKQKAFARGVSGFLLASVLLTPVAPLLAQETVAPDTANQAPTPADSTTTAPSTTPVDDTTIPSILHALSDPTPTPATLPDTPTVAPTPQASVDSSAPAAAQSSDATPDAVLKTTAPLAALSGGSNAPTATAPNLFSAQNLAPKIDQATGALTQRIPLDIPPGRNGLQPDLALEYNSQRLQDDSIVGYGWGLSLPYIERLNKRGSDHLYTDNYFTSSVSGELATSTATTSPNTYYARVDDGSFIKYVFSGNTWTAYDKNGTRYEYGTTTQAQQYDAASTTQVSRWMLEEVRDVNDNYIKYTYTKDNNQLYPSQIKYTGNGTTDGVMAVAFTLASSTASTTSYKTAFRVGTSNVISTITASVSGQTVRTYALSYTTGANTRRSLLSSVQETGRDSNGTQLTLPALTFVYASSSITFSTGSYQGYPVRNAAEVVADSNGDGINDLATFYLSNSTTLPTTSYIDNASIGTPPQGWAFSGGPPQPTEVGTRFVDVNGDGLADLVRGYTNDLGQTDYELYINTSTTTAGAFSLSQIGTTSIKGSIPTFGYAATVSHFSLTGGLFGNFNGDSFIDFERSQPTIGSNIQYLGNSLGWDSTSNYAPIKNTPDNSGAPAANSQLVDINGDGLDDWNWTDGTNTYFCLNTGTAWDGSCTSPWTLATSTLYNNGFGYVDRGMRFIDVNGDGLPDFVRSYDGTAIPHGVSGETGAANYVYLNTGSGWATSAIQIPLIASADSSGVVSSNELVDWNGDGMPDQADTRRNTGSRQDLLAQINYPKGGNTQVTYDAVGHYASSTNPNLPTLMLVVTQIKTSDANGNVDQSNYTYTGGKLYQANGTYDRKFAGFETMTENRSNAITTTYFDQGDTASTTAGERVDGFGQIGRVYRQDIQDPSSGALQKRTFTEWNAIDEGNGRSLVYPGRSLTQDFDSAGSTHRDHGIEYTYSTTTGDMTQMVDRGEVTGSSDGTYTDTGSDTRIKNITYVTNATTSVDVPLNVTVTDGSATRFTESKYTYDNLPYGSVASGLVTKQENWITGSTYASTTKGYDSYGLLASSTDERMGTTTYAYDTLHYYPATYTNALAQATPYTYDYATGKVATTTDPNGFVKSYAYDPVGRLVTQLDPDQTTPTTLVANKTITYVDTGFPTYTLTITYLSSATSTNTYAYVDGLGRTIQTRTTAPGTNTYVVMDTVYGATSLVAKKSLPYFASSTSWGAPTTTTALFATYTYDSLQRPTSVVNAVGTTAYIYNPWQTTITDANSIPKDLSYDAYGNLVSVVEHIATTTATTAYTYNTGNDLTNITDSLGNVRTFTYDGLSDRLTAQDLHAAADGTFGTWTYTYDVGKNLTKIVDPKSQTISYTYDLLSRMKTENYTGLAGNEITNTYDTCTNGVGYLCTASSTATVTKYTYTPTAWVKTETETINGTSTLFKNTYTYDRQGNKTLIVYPNLAQSQFNYNAAGLLDSVMEKPSGGTYKTILRHLDYAPTGDLSLLQYGNWATTTNTYNPSALYRLASRVTITPANKRIQDLAYTYDALGNITQITDVSTTSASKIATFLYDSLNRLVSANASSTYLVTTVSTSSVTSVSVLVLGGGGGGGNAATPGNNRPGGGGGAGGLVQTTLALTVGTAYGVTVGAGGAANTQGGTSSVAVAIVLGGGAGAQPGASSAGVNGGSGGSGGGGAASNATGGIATTSQGSNGGGTDNVDPVGAGGGGGAGVAGTGGIATSGGTGGVGTSSSISGSAVVYGGGGGGGAQGTPSGNGGTGGGGKGGGYQFGSDNGTAGTANTGGGGGGGGYWQNLGTGGTGGSGIVILSAPTGAITSVTGGTHTTAGGNDIWTFTTSGTFTINSAASTTIATATTTATSTLYNASYTYNSIGDLATSTLNATASAYTYAGTGNANPHAATTVASTSLVYDNNGNVTSYGTNTYSWDWNNRMTQAVQTNATSTYLYDYQSARTSQTVVQKIGSIVATTTTVYPTKYYSTVTTQIGSTTQATSTIYVFAGDLLIATMDQPYINGVATGTPQTSYTHADHLGSTNVTTDQSGNLLQTLDYYPYGSTRVNTQVGGANTARQFIGQFTDPTALSYLNARYYDGSRGQFLSEDPVFLGDPKQQDLTNPQSLNSYSYANGNPIVNKDPSGLQSNSGSAAPAAVAAYSNQVIGNLKAQAQQAWQNIWIGAPKQAASSFFNPTSGYKALTNSSLSTPERVGASVGVIGGVATTFVAPEGRVAIGATGKYGEAALENIVGGASQVSFNTSLGRRVVDQFAAGAANEAKTGYQSLTVRNSVQIAKDRALIADQASGVSSAAWHFFSSSVTGLRGPSAPLKNALIQAGIDIFIH